MQTSIREPNHNRVKRISIVNDVIDTITKGAGGLEQGIGIFGEALVGTKFDDVTVKFVYPYYNTDFDMKPLVTSGDGVGSVANGVLQVGSAVTGTVRAESKADVRYRSGHTGYVDFTFRVSGTTGYGEAGCVNENDGFFVAYDNDTSQWKVGRRKGGVDFTVDQPLFNGGYNMGNADHNSINIFRIMFGYLGVANAVFMVKQDTWRVVHVLITENTLELPTVVNPSFPVSVYAENGTTVYTASWNAGVFNGANVGAGSRYFATYGSDTLSAAAVSTLGTFTNKLTYQGLTNTVKVILLRYEYVVDPPAASTEGTIEFIIRKNATLAGVVTNTDIDADNSVMQIDTVRTYSSGGRVIMPSYLTYAAGGGNSAAFGSTTSVSANELGLFLLPGETATITAQRVAGNGDTTVRFVFNWQELF